MTLTLILPRPVFLSKGQAISADNLLRYEFGNAISSSTNVNLAYSSAAYYLQQNFSYWQPNTPSINYWSVNGSPIAADVTSPTYVLGSNTITYTRGNSISEWDALTIDGHFYRMTAVSVDRALASNTALQGLNAPTAQDVVDTARKFAAFYGNPANNNDCHNIAREVAAASGAVLPYNSYSPDPTQNADGGFWRIAYRGTDANSTSNWQSLVKAGDIVRMGWTSNGGPHTATILSVNPSASTIEVYDNTYYLNNIESIGIHTLNMDQRTIAKDITIYRLTTDNFYLTTADEANQTYLGSDYNDKFIAQAANDSFVGGNGMDLLVTNTHSKTNTIVYQNQMITLTNKVGSLGIETLSSIESIQFTDFTLDTYTLARTSTLNASQFEILIELYIASFNRAPDIAGLVYWGSRFADGMNIADIAKSFFDQPETIAAYPATMATTDFVTKVYNNILNRAPDNAGLTYWVNELNTGHVGKNTFLLAIINGAFATTGNATDRLTLTNKEHVGAHFAISQGLSNTGWAKDVMSGVSDQLGSVVIADVKTDLYAAIAATPSTSEMVIKLVGLAV